MQIFDLTTEQAHNAIGTWAIVYTSGNRFDFHPAVSQHANITTIMNICCYWWPFGGSLYNGTASPIVLILISKVKYINPRSTLPY